VSNSKDDMREESKQIIENVINQDIDGVSQDFYDDKSYMSLNNDMLNKSFISNITDNKT
jgi:hypothetical protein